MKGLLILGGARTPFAVWGGGNDAAGARGGRLKGFDPMDLGAAALAGALADARIGGADLDRIVFGNSYHVGPHACYGGRQVGLRAGVPARVPGVTVGLACGSGLYALLTAGQDLAQDLAGVAAVVGADAPSLIPRAVLIPSFKDPSCGEQIAAMVERLALERGFGREAQDRWALRSHLRARGAWKRGFPAEEIVPLGGLDHDDGVLPEPGDGHFRGSKPLSDGSTVTHANTHGIADGGAALILAVPEAAARLPAARPVGRLLGGAVAAMEPRDFSLSCAAAMRRALEGAGLGVADVDLFEVNETFAAQVLVDIQELALPEDKVNVNGGAIAVGHAFGGTGIRLVLSLLRELGRRGLRIGAAAVSLAGGQGIAVVVERLQSAR